MDELNDKDFVARLISGDAAAFDLLFSRLVPKICDFLRNLYGIKHEDAEEIAADAMVKVHRTIKRFQPNRGSKLTTWVFEIAKNTAIDYRRKHERGGGPAETLKDEKSLSTAGQKSSQGPIWQSNPARSQENDNPDACRREEHGSVEEVRLRCCLEALEETDRNLLLMKLVMPYDEIALAEGCSEGALRVRHSRAMNRLAEAYKNGENQ